MNIKRFLNKKIKFIFNMKKLYFILGILLGLFIAYALGIGFEEINQYLIEKNKSNTEVKCLYFTKDIDKK